MAWVKFRGDNEHEIPTAGMQFYISFDTLFDIVSGNDCPGNDICMHNRYVIPKNISKPLLIQVSFCFIKMLVFFKSLFNYHIHFIQAVRPDDCEGGYFACK